MADADTQGTIPPLRSLAGDWTFTTLWDNEIIVYGEQRTGTIEANYISNFLLEGHSACEALTLDIVDEDLLAAVVKCADEKLYFCISSITRCGNPVQFFGGDSYYEDINVVGNTVINSSKHGELRYLLIFGHHGMTFKYQEKNCLIPYPHGCLCSNCEAKHLMSDNN